MNSFRWRVAVSVLLMAVPCALPTSSAAAALSPLSAAGSTVRVLAVRDAGTGARVPVVPATKLVVFVVENHSLRQMRAGMPFVNHLATRYGYATRYRAITHPSLPNYLAIVGGSTSGVADDKPPSVNLVQGPSVFGQALTVGKTAATYAEGMPGRCVGADGGRRYAVRHNPWAYYIDERDDCRRFDVPLTHLAADVEAGSLPNVGLIIPDLCHDAHDCRLGAADAWLRRQVRLVMSGPDWAAGRLAVVITADEDNYSQNNRVLTVVAHPSIHQEVVNTRLNHYALSHSLSQIAGADPLASAATSASLLTAFGVPIEASSSSAMRHRTGSW